MFQRRPVSLFDLTGKLVPDESIVTENSKTELWRQDPIQNGELKRIVSINSLQIWQFVSNFLKLIIKIFSK